MSGLQDVIIKRRGGTNALTNVRAAIKALSSLKKQPSAFKKVAVSEAVVSAPVASEKKKTTHKS